MRFSLIGDFFSFSEETVGDVASFKAATSAERYAL
jgi:hypothetical protein